MFHTSAMVATEYWTSGSSEGDCRDAEQLFSWCSLDRTFSSRSDLNSSNMIVGNFTLHRCLALNVSESAAILVNSACADRKEFVCQVYTQKLSAGVNFLRRLEPHNTDLFYAHPFTAKVFDWHLSNPYMQKRCWEIFRRRIWHNF
jgi:hypothetical protein